MAEHNARDEMSFGTRPFAGLLQLPCLPSPVVKSPVFKPTKMHVILLQLLRGSSKIAHRSPFSNEYAPKRKCISACLRPWPFSFHIRPSILTLLFPVMACAFYMQIRVVCKSNRLVRVWQCQGDTDPGGPVGRHTETGCPKRAVAWQ